MTDATFLPARSHDAGGKFGPFAWMDHEMRVPAPRGEQMPAPMTAATFRGWVSDGDADRPVFERPHVDALAILAEIAATVTERAAELMPETFAASPDIACRAVLALMSGDRMAIIRDVSPYDRRTVEEARHVPVLDMLGIEDDPDAENDAAEHPLPRFETTVGYRPATDGTFRTSRRLQRMPIVGRTLPARARQMPYVRHLTGGYAAAVRSAIHNAYKGTDVVSDAYALRQRADAILRGTGRADDAALTHASEYGTEDRAFPSVVTHARDDARQLLKMEREALAALDVARAMPDAGKRRKATQAASRTLAEVRLSLQSPEISAMSGVRQRRNATSAASVGSPHRANGETSKTLPNNGHQDKPRSAQVDRNGKSLVTVRKATPRDLALVKHGAPSKRHQMGRLPAEPRFVLEVASKATVVELATDFRGQRVNGRGRWMRLTSVRQARAEASAAIAVSRSQRETVDDIGEAATNKLASHALEPGSSFRLYGRDGSSLSIDRLPNSTHRVQFDRPGMVPVKLSAGRDVAYALAAVRRAVATSPQVKQVKQGKRAS